MSSSRRVKKGPGRRPQSVKRRRFMELRERGLTIDAAAREVGVSRTAGRNWANGYKTYRGGAVVGFVAGLDRLEVREINARFLSQDERIEIADLHRSGVSVRAIARQVGRAPSTISRELRRNATPAKGYRPFEAQRRATARRARHHRRRIDIDADIRTLIGELLSQRWSPQQISRHLRQRFPDDRSRWLCHESIYQAIYRPGSTLMRHLRWLRNIAPRCAQGGIIAAPSCAATAAGLGSNNRCCRSTNGRSRPRTVPKRGIGRAT